MQRSYWLLLVPVLCALSVGCGGEGSDGTIDGIPDAADDGAPATDAETSDGAADAGSDAARRVPTPLLHGVTPVCDTFDGSFSWQEVAGARYTLEYTSEGIPRTVDLPVGTTSYQPAAPLTSGSHPWRVRASIEDQDSDWSSVSVLEIGTTPQAPSVTVTPSTCAGRDLLLSTPLVPGATYTWSGPDGFTSNEQNPIVAGVTTAGSGTYQVVVSVGDCASPPGEGSVVVAAVTDGVFSQALSKDFAANTNLSVSTADDRVSLVGFGGGTDGAFHPTSSTTLPGGEHEFTSVHIPAGVTVTVTGDEPLVVRSIGPVVIDGVLDVSGRPGEAGVTYERHGAGGEGVAGGGKGGEGAYSDVVGPFDGAYGTGDGAGASGSGWSGGGGGGFGTAGQASRGAGGAGGLVYGSAELARFVAGSGGGGGSGGYRCGSGGGGGGGGAVRIFGASIAIGPDGALRADGGHGGSDGTGSCGGGGGGSGGAIWLSSVTTVVVQGELSAVGGGGGASRVADSHGGEGGEGGDGRIRIDGELTATGAIAPTPGFTTEGSFSSGTSVTPTLQPDVCTWGALSFTTSVPEHTAATVDVLDPENSVLAENVASGTLLKTLPAVANAPAIRLRLHLSRTSGASPQLLDWSVAYTTQ